MFYTRQEQYEDFFTLQTKATQIAHAMRIVATDTCDRRISEDVKKNMETIYLLANDLDDIATSLDALDSFRVKNGTSALSKIL